jgi:hypothetical protein
VAAILEILAEQQAATGTPRRRPQHGVPEGDAVAFDCAHSRTEITFVSGYDRK